MKIRPDSEDAHETMILVDGEVHEKDAGLFFFLPFVCREVYSQTIPYLYSENTFTFLRCQFSGPSVGTSRDSWIAERTREQLG